MSAVQTTWLVTGRIAHAEDIHRDMNNIVVPQLKQNPPLASGNPPDPVMAACMARLAPYQLPRSSATDRERLAAFYLAVLAQDPRLLLDMAMVAPLSAWRTRPPIITPAY